jgi:hypothetical protein
MYLSVYKALGRVHDVINICKAIPDVILTCFAELTKTAEQKKFTSAGDNAFFHIRKSSK